MITGVGIHQTGQHTYQLRFHHDDGHMEVQEIGDIYLRLLVEIAQQYTLEPMNEPTE